MIMEKMDGWIVDDGSSSLFVGQVLLVKEIMSIMVNMMRTTIKMTRMIMMIFRIIMTIIFLALYLQPDPNEYCLND